MMPTVNVTGGWETVVEGTARAELERAILPDYLRAQRWFGGKGRRIEALRFVDWGGLPGAENRVFAVLLEVRFADDQSDLYFLPLGVSGGESAARMMQSQQAGPIARLIGPGGEAVLHDALADDDTCLSLVEAIGAKRDFATKHGQIRAIPTAAFAPLAGGDVHSLPVERGPAKSSNSLIFYGRRLMLKLFRRLECGINPEFEMGRFLTEGRLFQRIPCVAGAIEHRRSGAELITLAILQSFVVNQSDGWQHALDHLGRYYESVSSSDAAVPDRRSLLELTKSDPPRVAVEAIGGCLRAAGVLGRRTAEMHHALSAGSNNPAFASEPFTPRDADALRAGIRMRGESALAALRNNLDQLPGDVASSARQLLDKAPDMLRQREHGSPFRADAAKIRCHGDYHLGQVLRVEDDYVIIDFEGEPMRTVAERRAKQSPLKDLAGMLRSYHMAAYAGLFAFTQNQPENFDRLRPKAELWYQWVSAAFLRDYLSRANGAAFVPADTTAFAKLLEAFMLEKMFYELHYELNNRPDWVRIPLHHILTLVSP
ncbi:MAG TPA: putative maltokinase [Gemmataceae bacterium]|nr:putative maltokinase [Gemmataceae bacterium]